MYSFSEMFTGFSSMCLVFAKLRVIGGMCWKGGINREGYTFEIFNVTQK